MNGELTDIERALLIALGEGPRRAAELPKKPSAAARDQGVELLVGRGWVAREKEGKSYRCALTATGREALAALPPPTRAPRRAVAPARSTDGADRLAAIAEQVARIEAKLDRLLAAAPPPPSPPRTVGAAELKGLLLDAATRLEGLRELGGLVPIPRLRRELRERGIAASREEVDQVLLGLERDGAAQLLVAHSPASLSDGAEGIERPGRGLVYYLARGGA